MRKAIVYASVHHGNTEKLVKGIAEECQVDLIDAVKQPDADLNSYDMIGFASGIYFSKFHQSILEFAEKKLSDSAVLRHKNGKWYAVIMTVEKSKLGLEGNDLVEIMDVKCDPEMTSMIIQTYGFLPGYHMNKQHWITILLDGSVSEAKTLDFLDMSYDLIDGADRKEEK